MPKEASLGSPIFLCAHCGNLARHEFRYFHESELLYDEAGDTPLFDKFVSVLYECSTCGGPSLHGKFSADDYEQGEDIPPFPRLYPAGPDIDPARHTVSGIAPVPVTVRKAYRDAWFLQKSAPGAFANQIRRALEVICKDHGAEGKDLFHKLSNLAETGVFPPALAEVASLIRDVGNIASHADVREVNRWDAELLDALFRMIIEYVYVGPARLRRLKERIAFGNEE